MLSFCSWVMPMPVSATVSVTVLSAADATVRHTLPRSVNLSAFDIRFLRICSRRMRSVRSVRGQSSESSNANVRARSSAMGWKTFCRSFSSRSTGTAAGWISICPASILERSRMSLIRLSRSLPEDWIVCAKRTCSGDRLPSTLSPSSFDRISSELSGVRSSWLMFARKSVLYWLACSSSRALSCKVALARSSSSRWVSSACACSSSWLLVCSSSTCCNSNRACDSRSAAPCSSSSSFETRSSSDCACNSLA